jgi:mRNA interferase RelE/StbE
MYSVKFSERAKKQLSKLDSKVQTHIILVLDRIKFRPFSFLRPLSDGEYYRLRVGDYRVIIDARRKELLLLVIKVGHRKNIYK